MDIKVILRCYYQTLSKKLRNSYEVSSTYFHNISVELSTQKILKGQIKPKADWRAVDSPKKGTDEFDLFALKSKKANKTNLSIVFWENLWHANLLSKLIDLW